MKEAEKIDPKAQENQSRRIGLQDKLRQDVEVAKEDHDCLKRARAARFAATGEPSQAPSASEVK
jgi:hypothetical protein